MCTGLLAAQIKEQFALSFGCRDLNNAPILQNVLMHFSFNPMHGKRYQAHALGRIKALHSLHKTDITLLNKVRLLQTVSRVTAGYMNNKPQVSKY